MKILCGLASGVAFIYGFFVLLMTDMKSGFMILCLALLLAMQARD